MADAHVRTNRAKANFQALKFAITSFRRMHPDNETVAIEKHGDTKVRLVARIKRKPPEAWGLTAGDVLVDLRCALDYAIYALAVANGGKDPPDYAERLEFPICDVDTKWPGVIGRHKLHALTPEAIKYVKSIQPFTLNEGTDSALWALEQLVGIYKHRFIHVVWARLDQLDLPMFLKGMSSSPFTAHLRHIPGELKDGAELVVFELNPATDDAEFEVRPSITTKVVFEHTDKGWLDIIDFVGKAGAYIEFVVGEMEEFLTPGHVGPLRSAPLELRQW